jgi:hypothetical protein
MIPLKPPGYSQMSLRGKLVSEEALWDLELIRLLTSAATALNRSPSSS